MKFIVDIEASNLLGLSLDYSSMPFTLKDEFKIWCIVVRNAETDEITSLYGNSITKDNLKKVLNGATELIGHNIVNYDMPVLKLYGLLEYNIGYPGEQSTLYGKPCEITDTLLWSKLLNADRFGGHSLAAWGKRLGNYKGDFNEWHRFSQEMLEYCVQDTAVNLSIYNKLIEERGGHQWLRSYSMEVKLADIALKRELFGMAFDSNLAHKNIAELTEFMHNIAAKVDPLLPEKKMAKTEFSGFIPPKVRFKKNGDVSSHMLRFLEKHKANLSEDNSLIIFEGKSFPITTEYPLKSTTKATIEDIDVVKGYLLNIGWCPTEVKERDLVKNADKTVKNKTQIEEAITRYVKQTEGSLFRDLRLEHFNCSMQSLQKTLMSKIDGGKPIYVPTTPKLSVGVEKDICPNLVSMGEKAEFVKDVVHYYTYRHRKNSIAGGIMDEDGEPQTGFLSAVREDGRVPTPADTLGANTGRYRHRIICNIARVTSLYGEQMRNLFGSGKGLWQLGFDFASLEARIMGHHVIPYTDGEALAEALIAEKPNDIHSINARKLGIDRGAAKSFSYAAIYGAQPKKLSKMLGVSEVEGKRLFNEYWEAVPALKELKQKVEKFWEANGKTFIPGLDGRKLLTRSKHSLINVLFQSGGAIAAKWTTISLAKHLEELKLLGDPFVDNQKDVKVWLMIEMHDEVQMAVHPSLLSVVSFKTEEEAKAALVEGCSAIGHGTKGAYVGYRTQPVECIDAAIKDACKELQLKVELGFEWIPGLTWGQCH